MSQAYRLSVANASSASIDRERVVRFSFNDKTFEAFHGDTLASALLANGARTIARSFKYHRPRGIMTAGVEEPNALVQIAEGAWTVPNVKATQVEVYDGLIARSVNCWPSVDVDLLAINSLVGRVLPAGFYYKTFMWPKRMWMTYEQFIRKGAGLGTVPELPDPDFYDVVNVHCDVMVAGAGAAGLCAALSAARSGARVIIADEQSEFGGGLLSTAYRINDASATTWLAETCNELARFDNVTMLPRTSVFGYFDHNYLGLVERVSDHQAPVHQPRQPRERTWHVRAKHVVIATGAHERPIVFGNNDRPGVMMASAVSAYVRRYAVAPGKRVIVYCNNDSGHQTALDLHAAGAEVGAVVDVRSELTGSRAARLRDAGIKLISGSFVESTYGRKRVVAVSVSSRAGGAPQRIECDLLAVSGGFNPAVHLHAQSGGRPVFDDTRGCFLPGEPRQPQRSIGGAAGTFDLAESMHEGDVTGREAAAACGHRESGDASRFDVGLDGLDEVREQPIELLWQTPGVSRSKQFVDFQNDTTTSDLKLAVREGYRSIEHVKRYTLLGFGTDQGKLGNINGMAIVADALGQTIGETGTTTFRPPYTPVTFGALAGRAVDKFFDPVRKTSMHAWHEDHGAEFENVGQWKRPWYYPVGGESMQEAVRRECLATRESVGMLDASTLGKIDVRGPDSAEFLNWMYTNAWHTLEVGRCRYGLMLGEDGMVMDDGVTSRLGDNHFLMTTTTGGAAHVLAWMERWLQTEWPHMKVYLTSVTDHIATISIAGPKSRALLTTISEGIDYSHDAFGFMSFEYGKVAGVNARVARISFSGELAYEVNVPANVGQHVWDACWEAGQAFNVTAYGTETMHVLRAEKGYIIVGQDTDGSVTPQDLGMNWIVSKKKDFLGRRSLLRADCIRDDRKQFVGLITEHAHEVLPEGAQLIDIPTRARPVPMIGHVTSSYFSPSLNKAIALALVKGGRSRHGEVIYASLLDGKLIRATITDPVFIDPEGTRQHGD